MQDSSFGKGEKPSSKGLKEKDLKRPRIVQHGWIWEHNTNVSWSCCPLTSVFLHVSICFGLIPCGGQDDCWQQLQRKSTSYSWKPQENSKNCMLMTGFDHMPIPEPLRMTQEMERLIGWTYMGGWMANPWRHGEVRVGSLMTDCQLYPNCTNRKQETYVFPKENQDTVTQGRRD